MYQLHDMDKRYILKSIEKANDEIMDFDIDSLIFRIVNEIELTNFQIDFLSLLIKYNHEISYRYRNLLIEIINEGGE